jgi:ribonuclease R
MLPERISNELCSLRPHEDKLTFSAIFRMTQKGEIKAFLDRQDRHPFQPSLHLRGSAGDHRTADGSYQTEIATLNTLAQRFRRQRFKKGAINFSSTEVRFKLDEKGKPIGILVKESKESHQLVEEFMLLANRDRGRICG